MILNVLFWTLFLGLLGIVVSLFERRGRFIGWIARIWSRLLLGISGIKYKVVGLENLDKRSHYIFASNHESALDILLTFGGLPFHIVSISKKELKKIPIMGWAMWFAGHIFVDRGNHEKALASLDAASSSLKENPRSVLLFPEGTRSEDGKMKVFKKGGLLLGIKSGIPVVPIACCGTRDMLKKKSFHLSGNTLELHIGKPINSKQYSYEDRNAFVEEIRTNVIALKDSWRRNKILS